MEKSVERILIPTPDILRRLDELALQILNDYQGKDLTVIAILNGSLIFTADLLRRIPLPLKLHCITASSYHGGIETSGTVNLNSFSLPDLKGSHVLILDDILDTGLTLAAIEEKIAHESAPLSLKLCVLLRKLKPRTRAVCADYVGFDIGDEFVIGYGLDYREQFRNLPYIGVLADSEIQVRAGQAEKERGGFIRELSRII